MLAECVRWCSERYDRVVATCHTEASAAKLGALAPNVVPVRADWSDPDEWWRAVSDAVGGTPVALAVIWMHSTAGELYQRVHDLVPDEGVLVRIRGHATAKPGEGELASWIDAAADASVLPVPNERHVVLGWHRENGGQWLASDEIGSGSSSSWAAGWRMRQSHRSRGSARCARGRAVRPVGASWSAGRRRASSCTARR